MKLGIKIIVGFALFFSQCAWAVLSNSDLGFIRKYAVEKEVKDILDAHADEIAHKLDKIAVRNLHQHQTWVFDWLPGYFVKYNLARIHGMEKMKRCIENHNLDLLGVPDKRIYHIKGRPERLHNMNYVVVVKAIEKDSHAEPMTLRHVQQMVTLMRETEYISMTAANYIRTYNGKLVMIDTESNFDRKQLLSKGFMRLITAMHDINKDYTQEALQYILAEMAYLLTRTHGATRVALYKEIKGYLRKPQRPTWDYVSFFENRLAQAR